MDSGGDDRLGAIRAGHECDDAWRFDRDQQSDHWQRLSARSFVPFVCTVVVLVRPGNAWPLCLAGNRDEKLARAWDPPGPFWPGIVAGRDRTAGGTWLGINAQGAIAGVLNRPGSLGPAPGKRSRGELPLIALKEGNARRAAEAITALDAGSFRSFNLVLADREGAIFVRGLGQGRPEAIPLEPGVHMITAHDPDDPASPRVARHLKRFRAASPPEMDGWTSWRAILADRSGEASEQINVTPRAGFGTVCSALIGLRAQGPSAFLFAAGPPHEAAFEPVVLT